MNYLKSFWQAAKGKLTTYLALATASASQLADHAQDLRDALPALKGYLPEGPLIAKALHYLTSGLGLMIVWSRVRRILHP